MAVHVYPMDDWIEHKTDDSTGECVCGPSVRLTDPVDELPLDEPLIIHVPVDGRDGYGG